MSCFPCFSSDKKKGSKKISASVHAGSRNGSVNKKSENAQGNNSSADNGNIAAHTFTFRELASATNNFLPDCLLGEGGFGRVYKGRLENDGKLVAVKQLDRNGLQGNKEFVVEVLMLSQLHHENLVNLIGYCADGDQRLLVYEFMPLGSLEDHLLELSPDQKPLSWNTRMKIASGAAQGLEYLHDKANPPVIYRDLKSSNILLDEGFNPKLSDFGLAKLGPTGDKMHVSSRVMGTYGYCAPEYARTGQLTLKSDVYSFGVVLLELITGRRVIDTTKPTNEQNLVSWAQPMFKDQKRYPELVDPLIQDGYPSKSLNQAVAVAAMCLQEEASVRPLMADVVMALSFLVDAPSDVKVPPRPPSVKTPPIPEEPPQSDEDKTSSDEESSSSDAIQLGSNSRASRASRHESRRRSSSRYSQGSRQGSSSSSSRSHRESRHGSEGSGSKHNRGSRRGSVSSSSKHIQGSLDSSSSKRSRGSRRGSGHSSSKHIQGSPHGSDRSSSKHTEGSLHGSGRSASDWGSQYGSGRSSSRHSQGSEHESET